MKGDADSTEDDDDDDVIPVMTPVASDAYSESAPARSQREQAMGRSAADQADRPSEQPPVNVPRRNPRRQCGPPLRYCD